MDQVEEDGMELGFEHRHSIHARHPSSSLSPEPDEGNSESSAQAGADDHHTEDPPGHDAQESRPVRGKMHATTARNNGFLRYVNGVRALRQAVSLCCSSASRMRVVQ